MSKPKKFLTERQKRAILHSRHLENFRNFLSLEGYGDHVAEYIGMNAWELRRYVESLWQEGMTWENYRKEWCIDHIVALKYFNPFDFNDMALCWNVNNLIPAFMTHNHAKGYAPEVSRRMLELLPQSPSVQRLIEKVDIHIGEFETYYIRP